MGKVHRSRDTALKAREALRRHLAWARDPSVLDARNGPHNGCRASAPQTPKATTDLIKGVIPADRAEVCRDFNRAKSAGATARTARNAKFAPMTDAIVHRSKDDCA